MWSRCRRLHQIKNVDLVSIVFGCISHAQFKLVSKCFNKPVNRLLLILFSLFFKARGTIIFSSSTLAFVASSRQFSHPLSKGGNAEKQKFKQKKLGTPRKNAKIQLTLRKEGKCKRNQNDPNHSHVIFEGKSTLLKNCENFRMKTEKTV